MRHTTRDNIQDDTHPDLRHTHTCLRRRRGFVDRILGGVNATEPNQQTYRQGRTLMRP